MFSQIIKKISSVRTAIGRIPITYPTVLAAATICLMTTSIGILAGDGYLFLQSLSAPEPAQQRELKRITLSSDDIDEAIRILDQRKQQFDTVFQTVSGTTTIVF